MLMFVGGLMIACAVEHCNLHRRIAMRMLLIFGTAENRLMLGVMLPTWFLSMWISNTATTAMMTPICLAIIQKVNLAKGLHIEGTRLNDLTRRKNEVQNIEEVEIILEKNDDRTGDSEILQPDILQEERGDADDLIQQDTREQRQLMKALLLSIAYAANVGGTASLIGTPPNIVLLKISDDLYSKAGGESPISFSSWFMYGLPLSILCLLVIWIWIQLYFIRCRNCRKPSNVDAQQAMKKAVLSELDKLGPMSFAEWAVLGHFVVLVLLWFFRNPRFFPGWGDLFPHGMVGDASSAFLVVALMFVFPSEISSLKCFKNYKRGTERPQMKTLLSWPVIQKGVPWMVVWLVGGGYAIAEASEVSGLSRWIGNKLLGLSYLAPWVIIFIISLITALMTNVTSNTAIASVFLPIIRDMALALKLHPLYFMFPVTLATSFAFMLPVATPPNAIVFSTGRVKITEMMKAGLVLNIVCVCVLNLAANTWGLAAFDLGNFPDIMSNLTSL